MTLRHPRPMLMRVLRAPTQLYDLASRPDLRSKIPAPDPYGPHNRAPVSDDARGRWRKPRSSRGDRPRRPWALGAVVSQPTSQTTPPRSQSAVSDSLPCTASWIRPEAAAVPAQYERRHRYIAPVIRRALSSPVGWHYDGTDAKRPQLVSALPMIALRPTPILPAPRRSGEADQTDGSWNCSSQAGRAHLYAAGSWRPFSRDSSAYQSTTRNSFERAHRWPGIRHHRRSARHPSSRAHSDSNAPTARHYSRRRRLGASGTHRRSLQVTTRRNTAARAGTSTRSGDGIVVPRLRRVARDPVRLEQSPGGGMLGELRRISE